jgi:hypothetical protein
VIGKSPRTAPVQRELDKSISINLERDVVLVRMRIVLRSLGSPMANDQQ